MEKNNEVLDKNDLFLEFVQSEPEILVLGAETERFKYTLLLFYSSVLTLTSSD